jgi:SsrA-binding protein
MQDPEAIKTLCLNKAARHSYEIIETIEAGIVLIGPEVKSLRNGGGNIKDSYAQVKNAEIFLNNFHISPYAQASNIHYDPTWPRKLLLHRREIIRLAAKVKEKGLTLVPLKLYLKGNRIKVEIGLAKGRRAHSKKDVIKERDIQRETAREVKSWR